jgi:hypothetical protein
VVVESAVIVKLQEDLLVWERELDKRENTLMAREHGVVEGALGVWRHSRLGWGRPIGLPSQGASLYH